MDLNSNFIEELLSYSLNFSYLLPIIFLCLTIRKTKISAFSIVIFTYCLVFFTMNYYYDEAKYFLGKKNYYLIYTLLEYLTFTFLILYFTPNQKFRRIIVITSIAFTSFLFFFYTTTKIRRLDSIPIGIETILLFVYIFYFFFYILKKIHIEIYKNAAFWFVIGIFFYLGLTFFFNILADSLNSFDVKKYFHYSFLGDILKNIFFTIAIFQFSLQQTKKQSKNISEIPYLDMI